MNWILSHRYVLITFCGLTLLWFIGMNLMIRFNPEQLIIGQWQESKWSYEKIDTKDFAYRDVKPVRKHQSESWKFVEGNQLYFYRKTILSSKAKWKIKGRGHVLQLTYEDGDTELYNIKELNEHRLILNFDTGLESRGIAQLVFVKFNP
ncbi:MAG TPA: lipocalin family protein [Cytophagaceae bacterium]|nr:lipocalin family protein [Cytophagaceae bacterium]